VRFRNRAGEHITILDHVIALLAEMDLRYQQRFDAQGQALTAALLAAEKAVQTALIAAEKAVAKAETANEKRFESVNEFRKSLADQTANFLPRNEYGSAHQSLIDKLNDLAARVDKTEGRTSGLSDGTKLLLQLGGLVIAAIGLYLALK
jgi:PBP1b-binding outer membrane lipoprotein LpoB